MKIKIIKQIGKLVDKTRGLVDENEVEALKAKIRAGERPLLGSRRPKK